MKSISATSLLFVVSLVLSMLVPSQATLRNFSRDLNGRHKDQYLQGLRHQQKSYQNELNLRKEKLEEQHEEEEEDSENNSSSTGSSSLRSSGETVTSDSSEDVGHQPLIGDAILMMEEVLHIRMRSTTVSSDEDISSDEDGTPAVKLVKKGEEPNPAPEEEKEAKEEEESNPAYEELAPDELENAMDNKKDAAASQNLRGLPGKN